MKNNNDQTDALRKDGQIIDRAQNRLKKERLRILRKAKKGGWRAVAERRGVNVRYVYELAVRGIVPPNPETRRKLGLPRVMPGERKPKPKPLFVRIGEPGWEERYLRKLRRSR